jgi:hypothetical protein
MRRIVYSCVYAVVCWSMTDVAWPRCEAYKVGICIKTP